MMKASRRAYWFQHVPYEGLGSIETWLREQGFSSTVTPFHESADLPDISRIDFLIVMGGPMSVNDTREHPWLEQEIALIREAIDREIPVLGICLGAQLIARALDAGVRRHSLKEIGWFPVEAIEHNAESAYRFPDTMTVFQWHGDTFDLPEGATHLARSSACENQAFQFGSAIGVQFHLETTPESAQDIISNSGEIRSSEATVQTGPEMLAAEPERYEAINQEMARLLDYMVNRTA